MHLYKTSRSCTSTSSPRCSHKLLKITGHLQPTVETMRILRHLGMWAGCVTRDSPKYGLPHPSWPGWPATGSLKTINIITLNHSERPPQRPIAEDRGGLLRGTVPVFMIIVSGALKMVKMYGVKSVEGPVGNYRWERCNSVVLHRRIKQRIRNLTLRCLFLHF